MSKPISSVSRIIVVVLTIAAAGLPGRAETDGDSVPEYLHDRGRGLPTSMFGTYVGRGQLLVYPFFEYYLDDNAEYKPAELGYGLDQDFRGRYRAAEGLIFVSYGLTDWLAGELEAAVIDAELETSPDDTSRAPDRIVESGLGDVEGQIRLCWARETGRRPEVFSYFEAVAPLQKDKLLIGTPDWEFKLGAGLVKGLTWGTVTVRTAAEYSMEDSKLELGEYACEYLKRFSRAWRVYLGVEGNQDEVELITEVQWHFTEWAFVKLNNAFGVTSKATDWAPEIGAMLTFPLDRD